MFIQLNMDGVVVDVTDELKYVGKNKQTGKLVQQGMQRFEAVGVLNSHGEVSMLIEPTSTNVDFYMVRDIIPIDNLPEDYVAGKYIFDTVTGEFMEYTGTVPSNNTVLTENVAENGEAVFDMADTVDENSESIMDLAQLFEDLQTRVEALEEEN